MSEEQLKKTKENEPAPITFSKKDRKPVDVILENADKMDGAFLESVFDKEVAEHGGELVGEDEAMLEVIAGVKGAGDAITKDVEQSGRKAIVMVKRLEEGGNTEFAKEAVEMIEKNIFEAQGDFLHLKNDLAKDGQSAEDEKNPKLDREITKEEKEATKETVEQLSDMAERGEISRREARIGKNIVEAYFSSANSLGEAKKNIMDHIFRNHYDLSADNAGLGNFLADHLPPGVMPNTEEIQQAKQEAKANEVSLLGEEEKVFLQELFNTQNLTEFDGSGLDVEKIKKAISSAIEKGTLDKERGWTIEYLNAYHKDLLPAEAVKVPDVPEARGSDKVIEEINGLENRLKDSKSAEERDLAAVDLKQKMHDLKNYLEDRARGSIARRKLDSLSWHDNDEIADGAMEIMSEKVESIMNDFDKTAKQTKKLDFDSQQAAALVDLWVSVSEHKDVEGNNILIDDNTDLIRNQGKPNEWRENYSYVYGAVAELLRYKDDFGPKEIEQARKVLKMRSNVDVDSKQLGELIKAWQVSAAEVPNPKKVERSTRQAVYNNLEALVSLETQRPGTSRELTKDFGVMNFSRYPEEMLIKQCEEKDDTDLPYGIALLPRSDHNGAFYENKADFGAVFKKLEGKYNFIALEVENKTAIAKLLLKLQKRRTQEGQTEPDHKISFAFIGGHGTKDSIQFGDRENLSRLTVADLGGRGVKRSGKFFENSPTIMLASCSTGAEGGIGKQLSEMLGAKIIAPGEATSIAHFGVDVDVDGRLDFSMKFGINVGTVHEQGELSSKELEY